MNVCVDFVCVIAFHMVSLKLAAALFGALLNECSVPLDIHPDVYLHIYCPFTGLDKVLKMPCVLCPAILLLCEVWAVSRVSWVLLLKRKKRKKKGNLKKSKKHLLSQKETFYLTWQTAKCRDFPVALYGAYLV